jgi:hypothetical protein
MKQSIICSFVTLIIGFCFSNKAEKQVSLKIMNENSNLVNDNKLKIKVGDKIFTATLLDNATSEAFVAQLPLTIKMNELNNNEKYADLSKSIPTYASVLSSIQAGELMMYGSRTLVLFYKVFSTSYSYTKIGKIDDISGLAAALGSGDVNVSFEL